MKTYIDLCNRTVKTGGWILNERTGQRCLTSINATLEYDTAGGCLPVLTTKTVNWRGAIAEILGHVRGYTKASEYRALGCKVWDANANANPAWLDNPHRKGKDDLGRIYGAQMRYWRTPENKTVDQLQNVCNILSTGHDNRSAIITMLNPGEADRMCLNPCIHTYTFSLDAVGTVHLTVNQRSCDIALGLPFNMIQCAWLLMIVAQITKKRPGWVYHHIVNAHIYETHLDALQNTQIVRKVRDSPVLSIPEWVSDPFDLYLRVTPGDFKLSGYEPHGAIKYEMSV